MKDSFTKLARLLARPLRHPVAAWGAWTGYAAVIFFLSSQSISTQPQWAPHLDKFFHIIEYSVFGWLSYHAVHSTWPAMRVRLVIVVAIIISVMYGFGDEWHQSFVPMRDVSIADVVADFFGGTLGAWFFSKPNRIV